MTLTDCLSHLEHATAGLYVRLTQILYNTNFKLKFLVYHFTTTSGSLQSCLRIIYNILILPEFNYCQREISLSNERIALI